MPQVILGKRRSGPHGASLHVCAGRVTPGLEGPGQHVTKVPGASPCKSPVGGILVRLGAEALQRLPRSYQWACLGGHCERKGPVSEARGSVTRGHVDTGTSRLSGPRWPCPAAAVVSSQP